MKLRILIADDHDVVRRGVRTLLEQEAAWDVCGEASTGREALELAQKLYPDILITDLAMPALNGLELIPQIKRVLPEVEILVFTATESERAIRTAFQNGARGFLLKSEMGSKLISAVATLAQHKPVYDSRIAEIIFAGYADRGAGSAADSQVLTTRERETVQLIAEGKTNKEIAGVFGIAVKTVESHRAALMNKLGLASISDVVRYAIRNNIIEA